MYKVASDRRQSSLHHGSGLADWMGCGAENFSAIEKYGNLVRALNNLDQRIQQLPKGSADRKKLGLQKQEMQNEISTMKTGLKAQNLSNVSVEWCFFQICREQLLPAQFKSLVKAAYRLMDQNAAEAKALVTETEEAKCARKL